MAVLAALMRLQALTESAAARTTNLVRADLLPVPDGEPRPDGQHYEIVDAKLARRPRSRAEISGPAVRNRLIFLSIGHAHGRIWRCRTAKTSVRSARVTVQAARCRR
jgi:hypothetical protein